MLPARLRNLLILIPIAIISLGISDCSNNGAPEIRWRPEVYVASPENQAIVRRSTGGVLKVIKTDSPEFGDFACFKLEEFEHAKQAYFDIINQCEAWAPDND